MIYVQHDENGNITATVRGDRPPPHPRQVAYKDPPEKPPQKDVTVYKDEQAPDDLHAHRWDADQQKHVECPEISKRRANNAVLRKIADIEARQPRAVREHLLTGDLSAVQKLEDEIDLLRKQLEV